ncbi:MAG: DUF4956 domain-containing protein [Bacteroidales bacterium]|nr:DUF4956 domain-containing protein [Bacteroidales bacterium]
MKKLITLLLLFFTISMPIQASNISSQTIAVAGSAITAEMPDDMNDEDGEEKTDKMSIGIKDKRISDNAFIDKEHVINLLIAFFLNLAVIMIVVRGLYYPKCKRGEFFFTYVLIAISTFMLIYVLGDVKLKAGIALGLFAIFSIIRYRTEQVAIREMTYLFIIIAISAINGLTVSELSYGEVVIINILFILSIWICESKLLISHYSYKVIKYDNINLITPERREELIADLEKRTGLKIEKVEVGAIDFLKDAAIVKMYYRSKESNNSVDTTLKTPTDEYKLKE